MRRNNAKSEQSEAIKKIHRELIIKDEFTEPHQPQHDPAKGGAIKFLKSRADTLMNRTNSPEKLWFLCHQCIAHINNISANPNNNWKVPNEVSGGETQDISHLLLFSWMQPVLCLDPMAKFPESKEKPGHFVGFAECSGDALTFKILAEDMKQVLTRSAVRPADDIKHRNRRVTFKNDVEEKLEKQDIVGENLMHHEPIPSDEDTNANDVEEPPELMERTLFEEPDNEDDDQGVASRTRSKRRIVGALSTEQLNNLSKRTDNRNIMSLMAITATIFFILMSITFWVSDTVGSDIPTIGEAQRFKDRFEKASHATLSQLKCLQACDQWQDELDDPWDTVDPANKELWDVKKVLRHRIKNGSAEVKVEWKSPTKSTSWVDMHSLAFQDPTTILRHARNNHLPSQKPFSSLVNCCVGNAPSKMVKACKAKVLAQGKKFKFGVRVPFGIKQAMILDKENHNTM